VNIALGAFYYPCEFVRHFMFVQFQCRSSNIASSATSETTTHVSTIHFTLL